MVRTIPGPNRSMSGWLWEKITTAMLLVEIGVEGSLEYLGVPADRREGCARVAEYK